MELALASSSLRDMPNAAPSDPAGELDAHARPASSSSAAAILAELGGGSAGVAVRDESDFPFRVLDWKRPDGVLTAAAIAALTGHSGAAVEEWTLEEFFAGATSYHPGQSANDRATVRRYRKLVKFLQASLSAPRVYRFGSVQIHAYVMGVT